MKKLSKNIDKIGFYLLSVIIIIFSLIIGANEKGLRVLPISILLLLIIIFLICKKLIKKEESIFFKNKIDILVFIFILSTTFPLLFKTYASLAYEIEFILKYFFYYAVYVLARNTITKKEDINNIYTVIIFTSIIPIILGLAAHNGIHIFDSLLKQLNLTYQDNYKTPFTFGYSNTMAIYISVCIFLSLYKISNTKDKLEKMIYIVYSIFGLYIIYITYSRIVMLLFGIFLLIYILKKYNKIIVPHKKKIFTTLGILFTIGLLFIAFGINISTSIYTDGKVYDKILNYKFEKNKTYKIKIDADLLFDNSVNKELNATAFNLRLKTVNKYFKEDTMISKYYGNGHITEIYEFIVNEDIEYIKLYLENRYNGAMQINSLYINDEEYILRYKYLPERVGKFLNAFRFKDKSLIERYYFAKDSLKIFKRHMIFGNGGNSWKVLSKTNQDYAFSMKEAHSYFFELLISYGLVGIILFFIVLSNIFITLINEKKKEEKNILFYALGILLLHSLLFDFNMSFMFIEIIVYTLFACSLNNIKKEKNINKKYDYPVFGLLIITLLTSTYITLYRNSIISKKYYLPIEMNIMYNKTKELENSKETPKKKLKILKFVMQNEPYHNQSYIYNSYFGILNNSNFKTKEIDKYYDYIIKHMKKTDSTAPHYTNYIYTRQKVICNNIKSLENSKLKNKDKYIKKLKELLKQEYSANLQYLLDVDTNDQETRETKEIVRQYNEMYNEVK